MAYEYTTNFHRKAAKSEALKRAKKGKKMDANTLHKSPHMAHRNTSKILD